MKLAIMQPYFFPYLGYFQLIKAVDKFILYENISFRKNTWMTRNRILIKNSNPYYINIPVSLKSSNKRIYEIKIANDKNWKERLLKKIVFNYKHSYYFQEVFPILEKVISIETESLHTYNCLSICRLADILGINTKIQFNNYNYLELENYLHLKYLTNDVNETYNISERKIERAILITIQEQATTFINAIGGKELYLKEDFSEHNIDLYFLKTNEYDYKQFSNTFYKDLSIIDVLLNCGIEKTKDLLNNFELI